MMNLVTNIRAFLLGRSNCTTKYNHIKTITTRTFQMPANRLKSPEYFPRLETTNNKKHSTRISGVNYCFQPNRTTKQIKSKTVFPFFFSPIIKKATTNIKKCTDQIRVQSENAPPPNALYS